MIKSSGLIFLLLGIIFPFHSAFSQAGVGIGVIVPDQSAVLHVQAPTNNKGLLIPRLTTLEKNTIASPAEGLLVYDTDQNSLYHFNGSWQIIGTPPGGIIMWSGTIPPAGWALCDGNNNTPDLRGKFIVGYNPSYAKFDQPGNKSTGGTTSGDIGGMETVSLTVPQMPSHNHSITVASHTHSDNRFTEVSADWKSGGNTSNGDGTGKNTTNGTTGSATVSATIGFNGSGAAHENLPPFYTLAFIIKL